MGYPLRSEVVYPACRATFILPSWKRGKRKKALATTSAFFIEHARTDFIQWELVCCDRRTVSDKRCGFLFHGSVKERAKTRTNFATNFAKNEIYPGQAASVFFSGKVRLRTGICQSSGISGLYLLPVADLLKSDRDCWKQPAAWAHKIVSSLMNYTCMGALTCLTGLFNWYDSSKLLDERQIKESGGCWQSLLPLPAFSARESEGGSASRVEVVLITWVHLPRLTLVSDWLTLVTDWHKLFECRLPFILCVS